MTMFENFKKLLTKHYYAIAAGASIASLIIVFINDPWAIIIALTFFIVSLLIILRRILFILNWYIQTKNPNEFLHNSTFMNYKTLDGYQITYEVFKYVQCKRPIMAEFAYGYKWSGSKEPKISSKLQKIKKVVKGSEDNFDNALLEFPRPLTYNESTVIHFVTDLDDSDNFSKPYIESKIIHPTSLIYFRVELKHKDATYNSPAKIERKKINSNLSRDYELIKAISFDQISKSYEYYEVQPEMGYFYRISWIK